MEATQREINESKQRAAQAILDAEFFIAIVITPTGARVTTVGNGAKVITSLLDDDFHDNTELLEELTRVRGILGEFITDFLHVKDMPQYKMIKDLKRLKDSGIFDKIKNNGDDTRNG